MRLRASMYYVLGLLDAPVRLHLESPCRDLGAQNANLGPGLARNSEPVRIPEICVGKCLKTVLFGAPNGGRLPDGSDRLYSFLFGHLVSLLSRFGRPKCEFGARSGANCPACTNSGDLRGKVSENCVIRRAKWGSAARWLRSAVRLVECRWGRDLSAQIANLGPSLAQIAQPVRIAEICVGKCLKTVLFGAPNGGRLPDGSDRL